MMTTMKKIEKALVNACEHYNECIVKNDSSSVDALNDLVTAAAKYNVATGHSIQFVGDKDTEEEDVVGCHTIKRVNMTGLYKHKRGVDIYVVKECYIIRN